MKVKSGGKTGHGKVTGKGTGKGKGKDRHDTTDKLNKGINVEGEGKNKVIGGVTMKVKVKAEENERQR